MEISTDGSSWSDLGPLMTQNGYNSALLSGALNPIEGRAAFSGNSGGYVESTAEMPSSGGATARPGDAIRFATTTFSDEGRVTAEWTDNIESHDHYHMTNPTIGDFTLTRKK